MILTISTEYIHCAQCAVSQLHTICISIISARITHVGGTATPRTARRTTLVSNTCALCVHVSKSLVPISMKSIELPSVSVCMLCVYITIQA